MTSLLDIGDNLDTFFFLSSGVLSELLGDFLIITYGGPCAKGYEGQGQIFIRGFGIVGKKKLGKFF